MILQGFTEAVTQRSEYRAGFCCEDCGTDATWNIARQGSSITTERTVVDRTRSDIVIDRQPLDTGPVALTDPVEQPCSQLLRALVVQHSDAKQLIRIAPLSWFADAMLRSVTARWLVCWFCPT